MKTVAYQPEMGEVVYPEGFLDAMKDLPPEKQLKFFRTTHRSACLRTNWTERTLEYTTELEKDPDVKALILKDGYIAGVMMEEWFSKTETPVLPDGCVCTYYASDNNGSGYEERQDYTFFICVPGCGQ